MGWKTGLDFPVDFYLTDTWEIIIVACLNSRNEMSLRLSEHSVKKNKKEDSYRAPHFYPKTI